ncbi:hypothetical protein LPJ66_008667 [Kickxella alabastrina]|uniref:Uncharacterized protein n=1 Tax=Kickxella alabastrina TaxID=61397 RepID=A0ACC1I7X3_9FUNG|nr:hypothetical protein LPJ66_008667 [Kickxella alabastrina]
MARRTNASGGQRQQTTKDDDESGSAAKTSQSAQPKSTPANEGVAGVTSINKADVSKNISRRLLIIRRKLQRTEASEKKKEGGGQISAEQEAMVASIDTLRALVQELEYLSGPATNGGEHEKEHIASIDRAIEEQVREQTLASEALVHQQTLRLVFAVNEKLPRVGASAVADGDRTVLVGFYRLVFAGVGECVGDEVTLPPLVAINHLRQLAQRALDPVDGLILMAGGVESVAVSYAKIAAIVDSVVAAPTVDAEAPLLRPSVLVTGQVGSVSGVKMPKLVPLFMQNDAGLEEMDIDFNTQVIVPPGGLTFIASAEMVEGSDSDSLYGDDNEDTEKHGSAPDITIAMSMPESVHADISAQDPATDAAHVGGFVHPVKSLAQSIGQGVLGNVRAEQVESESVAGAATVSQADTTSMVMPDPAAHPALLLEAALLPVGFNPYGVGHHAAAAAAGSIPSWSAAGGTSAGSMGPGMYGVMPMPYPPHIAMQYGYMPPHMYGMQTMSPVAGVAPPGAIMPDRASPLVGISVSGSGGGIVPDHQQQKQIIGTVILGNPPAPTTENEMWMGGNINTIGGDAKPNQHMHGVSVLDNISAAPNVANIAGVAAPLPMMAPMINIDPYQHAMAAAAAAVSAGYAMNSPFMYPHIDASNLSTAATGGGSEHNGSVHSLESSSNRGGGSQPSSLHYPPHPHMPSDGEHQQRGFSHAEYSIPPHTQAGQYMWPQHQPQQQGDQHLHAKHIQAAAGPGYGGYVYSNQTQNLGQQVAQHVAQHQVIPQQQHQQQPNYQGQGYRRRGSGSNSNSSGGGSNHHNSGGSNNSNNHHNNQYPRDRRGNNGGYQRQQRWNNTNNQHGGYNQHQRQQHNNNNSSSSRYGQDQGQGGQGKGQQSQDGGAGFGNSSRVSANDGSAASGSSGYYARQQ